MANSVTVNIKDVYYDVRNNSYVTGNSRQDGTNFELVANMQASDDDEAANKICRAIQKGMGDIVIELSEYKPAWSGMAIGGSGLSITQASLAEATLTFAKLPSNFNEVVLPSIAQSVHAYLYERAMMDWFLATDKADAAEFDTLSQGSVQMIRKAINKRIRPERVTA